MKDVLDELERLHAAWRAAYASPGTLSDDAAEILSGAGERLLNAFPDLIVAARRADAAERQRAEDIAIARHIGAEAMRREASNAIATDENRRLDDYYCCSAMDGPTQTCGCCAISIRDELAQRIAALPLPEAPASVDVGEVLAVLYLIVADGARPPLMQRIAALAAKLKETPRE